MKKMVSLFLALALVLGMSACGTLKTKRVDRVYMDKVAGYLEYDAIGKDIKEIRVYSNDGTVLRTVTKQNEDDELTYFTHKEFYNDYVTVTNGDKRITYTFSGVKHESISYSIASKIDPSQYLPTKIEAYESGNKIWEASVSVEGQGRYIQGGTHSAIDNGNQTIKSFSVNEYTAEGVLISEYKANADASFVSYKEHIYDENFVKIGNVRFDENKKRINYYIDEYIDEYDASKGGEGGTHTLKTLNGYELGTATWDDTGKMTESNITAK